MKRLLAVGLVLISAGALAFRMPELAARPLHTDESVHTFKFRGLLEGAGYRYDPDEFHGPTLYYATLPVAWLSSARTYAQTTEVTYRLVPVLFGVGSILLLWLIWDGLGVWPTLGAGLLTAVSPAMVFYSRYYIHEMLLLFFTLLLVGAGWRYLRSPGLGWACLAGAALGLMHATKETSVLAVAALGLALAVTYGWERWVVGGAAPWGELVRPRHVWIALAVALLVSVTFFSSFFTNAAGPLDSLRTYLPWARRAEGQSLHNHRWDYYLSLLLWTHRGRGPVWTEGLIVMLALAGCVAGLSRCPLGWGDRRLVRFAAIYTVVLTLFYAVIPYKTPWCLLGSLQGMIWLAGAGAGVLLQPGRSKGLRVALGVVLAAGTGHLALEAWRASFPYAESQRNPYVYAHTSSDVFELIDKVEGLAAVSPAGHELVIQVMAPGGDYWPLPWYLRRFKSDRLGWYPAVPDQPEAEVIIASSVFGENLQGRLGQGYVMAGFFGLRPGVFLQLHVASGLWQRYLERAAGGGRVPS